MATIQYKDNLIVVRLVNKLSSELNHKILLWLILAAGVLLRIWQFFINRPMDRDELVMALNILKHDYSTITNPLYGHNGDPLGYIFALNIYSSIFGDSQFILRLPSLLMSIYSLFIFKKLSEKFQNNIIPAMAIFAGCNSVVWFSSSVKQYSSDLLLALLFQLLFIELYRNNSKKLLYLYIFTCPVIFWFSYTNIFHVATSFLVLGYIWRNDSKFKLLILTALLSVLSFILCQKYSIRDLATSGLFYQYWFFKNAYPPNIFTASDWYITHASLFFTNVGRFVYSLPIFLCFIFAFFKLEKQKLAILIIPFILTFIASASHYYPLPFLSSAKAGRFVIFLIPSFVICISSGLIYLSSKLPKGFRSAVILMIAIQPVFDTSLQLINPLPIDDVESALRTISDYKKPGDKLYAAKSVEWFYLYYKTKIPLEGLEMYWSEVYGAVLMSNEKEQSALKGANRVWILVRATHKSKAVLNYFNKRGKLLSEWHFQNCDLLLYDFANWQ